MPLNLVNLDNNYVGNNFSNNRGTHSPASYDDNVDEDDDTSSVTGNTGDNFDRLDIYMLLLYLINT